MGDMADDCRDREEAQYEEYLSFIIRQKKKIKCEESCFKCPINMDCEVTKAIEGDSQY